jgi:hypothetical protein
MSADPEVFLPSHHPELGSAGEVLGVGPRHIRHYAAGQTAASGFTPGQACDEVTGLEQARRLHDAATPITPP